MTGQGTTDLVFYRGVAANLAVKVLAFGKSYSLYNAYIFL